ncbi:unnamed protein product [Darwinula stevensoni]|uniref:Uncharacterized protein n=1 Tax=Darwinula stevensoni TaxID=69355 RepID=A0A7R9FND0_9CRUS|nr:unnamed protein product [Darwinula stevensoni]CAG0896341.1 unnamed protein product [Darwinula stevensoni]
MTRDIGGRDAEVALLSVITDPFVDWIIQIDSKVLTGWAESKPEYDNPSLLKHCSEHDSDSCLFPFSYDSCTGGLCTYVKEIDRWFAAPYIVVMFCLFPLVFLLSLGGTWVLVGVGGPFLLALIAAVVIDILQRKRPNWLPPVLRNWNFLPEPLHSLEPYDTMMMKLPCCSLCRMAAETSDEIEILPI